MQQHQRGRTRRAEARKPGERATLSMRMASDLWLKLHDAATSTGRSLSQEAELRLEQSFRSEALVPVILETAFGRQAAHLAMLLARRMRSAANACGIDPEDDWLSNPDAFEYTRSSIATVFKWLKPEGEPNPSVAGRAENHTEMTMRDIAEAPLGTPRPRAWHCEIREGLGDERLGPGLADWKKAKGPREPGGSSDAR
jgi:hypothetical protein